MTDHVRMAVGGALIAALTSLAGCGGEDDRPARFDYIWAAVIRPSCTTSGCHSKLAATYGVNLNTMESAYYVLTGRQCGEELLPGAAPRNFVAPGQPELSKLMYLLTGDQVRRMPPDAPLPEPDIALVERWILEGAPCE